MRAFLTALFAAALLSTSALGAAPAPLTSKDVEEIVKQVIRDNPELIMKSVQEYASKMRAKESNETAEATKNIPKLQNELKNDKGSPVAGNPKGDITLVEFFDYHCGYCKHMLPVVSQLLEDDKNVRLVLKELPILSPDSVDAAKASIAVFRIEPTKYFAYHTQLMGHDGSFDEGYLLDTAKKLGINTDKLKKEMQSPEVQKELDKNHELSGQIGVRGTPAFIINTQLIPGAVPIEELKSKIQSERAAQKKK